MLGGIGFGLFLDEVTALRKTAYFRRRELQFRSERSGRCRYLDPAPRRDVARSSRIKHENAVLARLRDENFVRGIECNSVGRDEIRTLMVRTGATSADGSGAWTVIEGFAPRFVT